MSSANLRAIRQKNFLIDDNIQRAQG